MESHMVEEALKKILRPSLLISYMERTADRMEKPPVLSSYAGGEPYLEMGEKEPVCPQCYMKMTFVFQFYEPYAQRDRVLSCYYQCFACFTNHRPSFEVRQYLNPDSERSIKGGSRQTRLISPVPLMTEPAYSLPDWDDLLDLYPEIADEFTKKYQNDSWHAYDSVRRKMTGHGELEYLSLYKGYPQLFYGLEEIELQYDFWLQLESRKEQGLLFGDDGILYLFRHKKNQNVFYAHIYPEK